MNTVVVRISGEIWKEILQLRKHLQVPMSISKTFDMWPRCPVCGGLLVKHISDSRILVCPRCNKQYVLSPIEVEKR